MLQDKEEKGKRQVILGVALKVFSEKGYHCATIDEIARQAEIGKGTVYEYFPSKEALFHDVIQAGVGYYVHALEAQLAKRGTVYDRLKRLYRYHLHLITSQSEMKEIISNEMGKIPDELKKWMRQKHGQLIDTLQAVIEAGIATGEVRPVRARVAAHLILSGMRVVHLYVPGAGESMEEMLQEELSIIWEGLNGQA